MGELSPSYPPRETRRTCFVSDRTQLISPQNARLQQCFEDLQLLQLVTLTIAIASLRFERDNWDCSSLSLIADYSPTVLHYPSSIARNSFIIRYRRPSHNTRFSSIETIGWSIIHLPSDSWIIHYSVRSKSSLAPVDSQRFILHSIRSIPPRYIARPKQFHRNNQNNRLQSKVNEENRNSHSAQQTVGNSCYKTIRLKPHATTGSLETQTGPN